LWHSLKPSTFKKCGGGKSAGLLLCWEHYIKWRFQKSEDKNAKEALEDPEYFKLLKEFDEKLWSLTDPLWEERLK